jgi:hypothetical protein
MDGRSLAGGGRQPVRRKSNTSPLPKR